MAPWICPECDRQFGRRHQSHLCAPTLTADQYFASRPPAFREIYEAVLATLAHMGPVVVDVVDVGVLIKRARTFAELRPRRDRFVLSLWLSRALDHPRVRRTVRRPGSERAAHFFDLRAAADVDDEIAAWLAEAYDASPD